MADPDDHYDAVIDGLLVPKQGQRAVGAPDFQGAEDQYNDAIGKRLAPASRLLRDVQPINYDPNSDWDGFRQAFDAAIFGKFSKGDAAKEKAKENWEKTHPAQKLAADFVGSSAPGTLLGIGAGQTVFRAGLLGERLGAPVLADMAKFLTGTAEGGRLLRGLSLATWGAGQGAIQSGYERAMGQPSDLGANMLLGAGGNVGAHIAFSPQMSNIAPGVQQAMRDWSAQGLTPSMAQVPGASSVVRLWGRLFGRNAPSMEDVTRRLMQTAGSTEERVSAATVRAAREGIRGRLGGAFAARDPAGNYQLADADMANQLNAAVGLGTNTGAQRAAYQEALSQWHNADVLDRIARNSGADGIATPRALISAARDATARGAPVSPVFGQLAPGAEYFGNQPRSILPHATGAGVLATLGGAEALDKAMPFVEQVIPGFPGLAHAAGIYGGANVLAGLPAALWQSSRPYAYLAARGGVGPGVNPLVPAMMQNEEYQRRVQPITKQFTSPGEFFMGSPAQGAEAGIQGAADASGLDPKYVRAIASIESDSNPLSNRNKATRYKGLFQLSADEFQANGGGNIYDAGDNARAFGGIAKSNADWFRSRFGRDPTPTQIYLMHLQGRGFYDRGTMTNVAGNPYPGMSGPQTPASFEAGWGRELERRANRLAGIQVAPGPTSAGFTSVLQPMTGPGPSQDEISNALAGSQ